jgi:hypothetical protein
MGHGTIAAAREQEGGEAVADRRGRGPMKPWRPLTDAVVRNGRDFVRLRCGRLVTVENNLD